MTITTVVEVIRGEWEGGATDEDICRLLNASRISRPVRTAGGSGPRAGSGWSLAKGRWAT